MDESTIERNSLRTRVRRGWNTTRLWLIFLFGVLGTTLALSLGALRDGTTLLLEPGDVAAQDILAPHELAYESQVLTEQARDDATEAVTEVYDPPDSTIARNQIEQLTAALAFVSTVRSDAFATPEQQLQDLLSMDDVRLGPEHAQALLDLSLSGWTRIRNESIEVLEQVMRGEIREGRVDDARRGLPTLVSISLSEEEAELVTQLVGAYVAANALYNEDATGAARAAAREALTPVSRTFAAGETVIARGEVVQEIDIEALTAFGLMEAPDRLRQIGVVSLFVTLLGVVVAYYLYRVHPEKLADTRLMWVTSLLFVVTALGIGFALPRSAPLPYLFPAATLPMVFAVLISPGMGLVSAMVLGLEGGFVATRGLELATYMMISGVLGALVIGKAERLGVFVQSGIAADLGAIAVAIVFLVPDPTADLFAKAQILGGALATGILSAGLAFGGLILIGSALGITTNLQLMELSRPDHPLLQQLLRAAPGTYQHSLQVANLAEQAARTIGANALLIRVGAQYHDVGKSVRPQFFVENQLSGQNPHDQLDPATSASIILSHVPEGVELAKKHRLPQVVIDFIPEHHGTMRTTYQYQEALAAAGDDPDAVDPRDFSYRGPRPRTRESAILMLADGVEAKIRADQPADEASLAEAVRWVIDDRLEKGQLARTDLTFRDLDTIHRSFVNTLRSIYHARVRYPTEEAQAQQPDLDPDTKPVADLAAEKS